MDRRSASIFRVEFFFQYACSTLNERSACRVIQLFELSVKVFLLDMFEFFFIGIGLPLISPSDLISVLKQFFHLDKNRLHDIIFCSCSLVVFCTSYMQTLQAWVLLSWREGLPQVQGHGSWLQFVKIFPWSLVETHCQLVLRLSVLPMLYDAVGMWHIEHQSIWLVCQTYRSSEKGVGATIIEQIPSKKFGRPCIKWHRH